MRKALLLIITIFVVLSCTKKQPIPEAAEVNLEKSQAEYFSGYTEEISSDQNAILRFAQPLPFARGKEITDTFVSFDPKVSFKTVLKNHHELELVFDKELTKNTYMISVDIGKIYGKEIDPLKLPLRISRRMLTRLSTSFDAKEGLKRFSAFFSFSGSELTEDNVKSAVSLSMDKSLLNYSLQRDDDNKGWILQTDYLDMNRNQNIEILFRKDVLVLDQEILRNFLIPDEIKLDIINTHYEQIESKYVVVVSFSEFLDFGQNITNLISIDGIDDIGINKVDNRAIISGSFEANRTYKVTVKKGILATNGYKLAEDKTVQIQIRNELANMMFAGEGNILTSLGDNKIRFRSINVKTATVIVKKVFENNLGFFLHDRNISGSDYYWNFSRLGIVLHKQKIEIDSQLNTWVENDLDLNKILSGDRTGLYTVEINFNNNDCIGKNGNNKRLSKNIIISDLALTMKEGKSSIIVATDLATNQPAANAMIYVMDYQNQLVVSGKTDSKGFFRFAPKPSAEIQPEENYEEDYYYYDHSPQSTSKIHYILAEYKDSKTILNPKEMRWNTSTFDVKGVEYSDKGTAFIYTERGVYRPGDEINFTMIFRNNEGSFPENQPVIITIFDPMQTKILNTTLTKGRDGVFTYRFVTSDDYKTGNWQLKYETGGISGSTNFKIETVVAERLKLEIVPEFTMMNHEHITNLIELKAAYLFGAPAKNLKASITANFSLNKRKYQLFPNFTFYNSTVDFYQNKVSVLSGTTNEEGIASINWKRPDFSEAPTGITVQLDAEVIDEGGRASKTTSFIGIDPFQYYVGIKLQEKMISYRDGSVEVILVDPEGNPVVGEQLEVKVYQNNRYWWWDYSWEARNSRSYKNSNDTNLVFSRNVNSESKPVKVDIGSLSYGKYLVEVTHKAERGHTASSFFYPRWWGETQGGIMEIGAMQIRTDKKEYLVGDEAQVQFDAPENCRVLVSLEDNDNVRDIYWIEPEVKDGKAIVKIKTDSNMIPNIYCTISVLQNIINDNDLPIRSYGTIPIKVIDPQTVNNLEIRTPEIIKPNSKFTVEIQSEQKRKSQVTIAVVDEGLLSLTNFRTPAPWQYFFRKRLLKIATFDNYGFVMGIMKGDVYKTFSVGGDFDLETVMAGLEKKKEINDLLEKKAKRFEAVSFFSGILETDINGYLSYEFKMPHYIGAVRVMAVSAVGNAYGSGEKTVPVKDELMIQPTLPRFISPGDQFVIPIEIFADNPEIKKVDININIDGPVSVKEKKPITVTFEKPEQKLVFVDAVALDEMGTATFEITAVSGVFSSQRTINLPVYPSMPTIYKGETKIIDHGSSHSFMVPDDGYPGSMTANIQISKLKKLDFKERLNWLIRYPYGCLEQTTSAVFPQLFLKDLAADENLTVSRIDKNINEGITTIRKFQTPAGGLGYWQGDNHYHSWTTNYALHFLLEADKQGYFVPKDFLNGLLDWTTSLIKRNFPTNTTEYTNQVYSLYLLALGQKPYLQGMNIIYESHLDKLPPVYQWLLAATYKLAGSNSTASDILTKINPDFPEQSLKDYHRYSWGSPLRDEAILLIAYNILDKKTEAFDLFNHIAEEISGKDWYSTQTLGFCLTAMGDFYRKNRGYFDSDSEISGTIVLSDGQRKRFSSKQVVFNLPLKGQFGKSVTLMLDDNIELEKAFVTLNWNGVSMLDFLPTQSNGLEMSIRIRNNDGEKTSGDTFYQGEVFEVTITVDNKTMQTQENLALVQYLPAGWEIENDRVSEFSALNTEKNYDYLDIRDDKIMWFFELPGSNRSNSNKKIKSFTFKARAVTQGNFKLPSAYCEAMYNSKINASLKGKNIRVLPAK
ncbi:MAG: MG2 domain-containing protein [Candidatus Cloacimonetes bacterium]|nr:MG2 domain-containing protein [Candidatus Cloacimonadota bacterium]